MTLFSRLARTPEERYAARQQSIAASGFIVGICLFGAIMAGFIYGVIKFVSWVR